MSGKITKISFKELCNKSKDEWNKAVIVFSQDSFNKPFTETERSYQVESSDKYFDGSKIGNSLFGDCLDGKDSGIRLDCYMELLPNEGKRWIPEYCYILE